MTQKELSFTAYVHTLNIYLHGTLSPQQAFDDIIAHCERFTIDGETPCIQFTERGNVMYDVSQVQPFTSPDLLWRILIEYLGEEERIM